MVGMTYLRFIYVLLKFKVKKHLGMVTKESASFIVTSSRPHRDFIGTSSGYN